VGAHRTRINRIRAERATARRLGLSWLRRTFPAAVVFDVRVGLDADPDGRVRSWRPAFGGGPPMTLGPGVTVEAGR
jgi:hypothetical protein